MDTCPLCHAQIDAVVMGFVDRCPYNEAVLAASGDVFSHSAQKSKKAQKNDTIGVPLVVTRPKRRVPATRDQPLPTQRETHSNSGSADVSEDVINRISSLVTANVTRELNQLLNAPPSHVRQSLPPADPLASDLSQRSPDIQEVPISDGCSIQHQNLPPSSTVRPSAGELVNPFMSRVIEKVKQKNWNHEYADFGALVVNPTAPPRYKVSLDSNEAQLTLEAADKPRKITTIESWLTALHIFVGMYTSKYSSEAPTLMKYGSLIRDLETRISGLYVNLMCILSPGGQFITSYG
ncbi:hypothetical protein AC249_AIPGENE7432 [Exaiptasia diaphana]|nr:hypothetical protein AC249_AIPGENE7432 [Exaiptasia diaphana]